MAHPTELGRAAQPSLRPRHAPDPLAVVWAVRQRFPADARAGGLLRRDLLSRPGRDAVARRLQLYDHPLPARLARQRPRHRLPVPGCAGSMAALAGVAGVSGRGRAVGLRRVRQHGRPKSPTGRRDDPGGARANRPTRTAADRLGRSGGDGQCLCAGICAAQLAFPAHGGGGTSRRRGHDGRRTARRCARGGCAVRLRSALLGRSAPGVGRRSGADPATKMALATRSRSSHTISARRPAAAEKDRK